MIETLITAGNERLAQYWLPSLVEVEGMKRRICTHRFPAPKHEIPFKYM
jgi:hypothetical protein